MTKRQLSTREHKMKVYTTIGHSTAFTNELNPLWYIIVSFKLSIKYKKTRHDNMWNNSKENKTRRPEDLIYYLQNNIINVGWLDFSSACIKYFSLISGTEEFFISIYDIYLVFFYLFRHRCGVGALSFTIVRLSTIQFF